MRQGNASEVRVGGTPGRPDRRTVVTGLATLAATAGASCRAEPAREAVPLARLGVDRFSDRDQQARLDAAFTAAREGGFPLLGDPDAVYRHDGVLALAGASLDGQGCAFRPLSDGPQAMHCTGRGWRLANVRLLGAATGRSGDDLRDGLFVGGDQTPAAAFTIEKVTVEAVEPGRGVAAAGIMFNNAADGQIADVTVRNSLADGIHCTNGSRRLVFDRPTSDQTGDDGFAVVSYRRQNRVCRDITVRDGTSRLSHARGFTIAGGVNIVFERPRIERSDEAGVYLFGEGAWDTFGVSRCRVIDPVLLDCCTGAHQPADFRHAALLIGGRDGTDPVEGEQLGRGVTDCVVERPVIEGVGRPCFAAISIRAFTAGIRIAGARLSRIVPPPGGPVQPNGIELGGRDLVIEAPVMTDVAGYAMVGLASAAGRTLVDRPTVTHACFGPGPTRSFIFAEAAAAPHELIVQDGTFSHGPAALFAAQAPSEKLRSLRNRVVA